MVIEDGYLTAQARGRGSVFWGVSIAVHATAAVLLLYTPAKDYILSRTEARDRPPMRIRGEELKEFVEDLRDQTCEEIRSRVELLQAGQQRMASNFETMHRHYFKDFEEEQRRTARARLDKYMADAVARQKRVSDACASALASKESGGMLAAWHAEAAKILAGMEEIERGLRLIKGLEVLVPAQRRMLGRIHSANQFHRYHESAVQRLGQLAKKIEEGRAKIQALRGQNPAGDAERRKRDAELARLEEEISKCAGEQPKTEERRLAMIQVARNIECGTTWRQQQIIDAVEAFFRDGTPPVPPPADEAENGEPQD